MWRQIQATLVSIWEGPPHLSRALRLEWRFVVIRWLGIVCVTPGLLLAPISTSQELAAFAVLAVAAIYNGVLNVVLQRRPSILAKGIITTTGDALLAIAMMAVGGGFNSSLYFILYTITIAAAMRYGYAVSVGMSLLFVGADIGQSIIKNLPLGSEFVLRSGFLVLTVVLASYLHEQAERSEAALQERLDAAEDLTAAMAKVGASLDLEMVLQATVTGACQLFESRYVLLLPTAALTEGQSSLLPVSSCSEGTCPTWWNEFTAACAQVSQALPTDWRTLAPIFQDTLVSGQTIMFLTLGRPTRHEPLATLAVVVSANLHHPPLAPDVVRSFREHVTLAIENASLYRTLTTRSADLQAAYADLAVAHQELLHVAEMKTNFLANVSHEFRTPLSSIRSFSELLLTYDDPMVQRDFLEIINQESERLTRMVNDVLDITKIESGNMNWEMAEIDVEWFARETARTYVPIMNHHNLVFTEEISPNLPPIYGDWDRLRQVMGNLLDNAVKFTRKGRVSFSVSQVGDEIRFAVADTGVGVAVQDQVHIFEKFQQVGEVLTDKPRGAGLGLSICREIVEFHHGRIWVESELGHGSTFIVALPTVSTPVWENPETQIESTVRALR
jgi:signal transduction histidine kinase